MLVSQVPVRRCLVGLWPAPQAPPPTLGSSLFHGALPPYCLASTLHLLFPLPAKSFHLMSRRFPPPRPSGAGANDTCSVRPLWPPYIKIYLPSLLCFSPQHWSSSYIQSLVFSLSSDLPYYNRMQAPRGQDLSSVRSSFPAHQAFASCLE